MRKTPVQSGITISADICNCMVMANVSVKSENHHICLLVFFSETALVSERRIRSVKKGRRFGFQENRAYMAKNIEVEKIPVKKRAMSLLK